MGTFLRGGAAAGVPSPFDDADKNTGLRGPKLWSQQDGVEFVSEGMLGAWFNCVGFCIVLFPINELC